jgi:hypothetical protein
MIGPRQRIEMTIRQIKLNTELDLLVNRINCVVLFQIHHKCVRSPQPLRSRLRDSSWRVLTAPLSSPLSKERSGAA